MGTTVTGDKVLSYLRIEGVVLSPTQKDKIQAIIHDAIVYSYAEGKAVANGKCDCGQMSCPECHG